MGTLLRLGEGGTRIPDEVKKLKGTLRKHRVNATKPALPPIQIPSPSPDATDDERAAWIELASLVNPLKVTTASDLYAFRRMVETAAMLAALRRSLRDSGGAPVYELVTKSGVQLLLRPEVNAIPTYEKLMLHHFARWGIDPADRSRVTALADEKPKTNPIAKFGLGATIKTKGE